MWFCCYLFIFGVAPVMGPCFVVWFWVLKFSSQQKKRDLVVLLRAVSVCYLCVSLMVP